MNHTATCNLLERFNQKKKGKVFSLRFTSDGKVKGIRHPLPLHSGLKECIYPVWRTESAKIKISA